MPTTYTHYRFGKDVIETLPQIFQNTIQTYRELYDIGLHGPDILFFYEPLNRNQINYQGSLLHEQCAYDFFEHACEIIERSQNPVAASAYIYGVICHFALDSECHPYIEKMIHESGISHNEIEMELDRMLMEEDSLNPLKHLSTGHIHPIRENASIIAPFFDQITPKQMQKSLKSMVFYHKLFLAPGKLKRKALFSGMKLLGKYEALYKIIISLEPNMECHRYCLILKKLYEDAVPLATDLILEYQKRLDNKEELSGRFYKTFGAGDEWESLLY